MVQNTQLQVQLTCFYIFFEILIMSVLLVELTIEKSTAYEVLLSFLIIVIIVIVFLTCILVIKQMQIQKQTRKPLTYSFKIVKVLRNLLLVLIYAFQLNDSGFLLIISLQLNVNLLQHILIEEDYIWWDINTMQLQLILSVILNGILNNSNTPQINYTREQPWNVVLVVVSLFALFFVFILNKYDKTELYPDLKKPKNYHFQNSFKQEHPREDASTPIIKIDQQSPNDNLEQQLPQDIQAPPDNNCGNNLHVPESSYHQDVKDSLRFIEGEEEKVLQDMGWIQNQQVLVFDNNYQIVFQNFFLGQFLKKTADILDQDYTKLFLSTKAIVGNRDLFDMFKPNDSNSHNNEQISLYNYKSSSFENQKYRLPNQSTVLEIINNLVDEFYKTRCFLYVIYKMENLNLDLDNHEVRIFVKSIEGKYYIFFLFELATESNFKQFDVEKTSLFNLYQTFLRETSNYVNCCLTLSTMAQFDPIYKQVEKYLSPIRLNSVRYNLFVQNLRDHSLFLQNQLFLKITIVSLKELIDDICLIYSEPLKGRETTLTTNIETLDNLGLFYTDQDRLKQVLSTLLQIILMYSLKLKIRLELHPFNNNGVIVHLKVLGLEIEEILVRSFTNIIKQINQQFRSQGSLNQLDINANLEIQIVSILCYMLSSNFKKGLEVLQDRSGVTLFTFYVENTNETNKQSGESQIKQVSQKKYFETSLSMLLAQQGDSRDQSMSFSKQFSVKQSEIDQQSVHFSQISKIKIDSNSSKVFLHSNSQILSSNQLHDLSQLIQQQDSIFSRRSANSFSRSLLPKQSNKKLSSDKINHDSPQPNGLSQIDFGPDTSYKQIEPPVFQPKMLSNVIKYKLTSNCCSKVLTIDPDFYSHYAFDLFFQNFGIVKDQAFNGSQALEMIKQKSSTPCRCGNKSYLLYFIEINLPNDKGLQIVRDLKNLMKQDLIDRGFAIASTCNIDLNTKLECFKHGMDYFVQKPLDLFELNAIIKYLLFQ